MKLNTQLRTTLTVEFLHMRIYKTNITLPVAGQVHTAPHTSANELRVQASKHTSSLKLCHTSNSGSFCWS